MNNDGNDIKKPKPEIRRGADNNNEDPGMNRILRQALGWVAILTGAALLYIFFSSSQQSVWSLSYTEYQRLLEQNEIKSATIYKSQINDYEFHGVLKRKQQLMTEGAPMPVEVENFKTKINTVDKETEQLWSSKGITWSYVREDSTLLNMLVSILPWILILGVWIFFMRRMQGGPSSRGIFTFGKSKARMMNQNENKVTFEDVAGADEAKQELQEIIEFLRNPERFQHLGGKIPKGVLLLGPPGTGKTLLARAVAGEANAPFFSISGADFVEMFVGVGASRVRDLFEQAQKNSPCIIFIDEIDAVGRHRGAGLGGGHDEREQTLNQLLVEMDGFEQNSGIIVIAATNRADVLDPALLRPGRFDRQVVVDRPDIRGRLAILKVHVRKVPIAPEVNLEAIARGTPGLSGADLANLVNEAALLAARSGRTTVLNIDFENAKDKILMGVERRSMVISEAEKRMTAYHEMGHALAGKLLPYSDPVHKVTIIPRGRALGVTSYLPSEDSHTYSRDALNTKIIVLLAGRAAEKIVFNSITTGAGNDIERATALARKMVCEWGMSDTLGPVNFAEGEQQMFMAREISHHKSMSEETARVIDAEIRGLINGSMKAAEDLLNDNIELLHKTSEYLLKRETLTAEELDIIIAGEELPAAPSSAQAEG